MSELDWSSAVRALHPHYSDEWVSYIARLASAIEVRVASGAPSPETTIDELRRDPGVWVYPASIIAPLINPDAAERERALQAEVDRLRGKCNRLIEAYCDASEQANRNRPPLMALLPEVLGLEPDDLDPELHGATQEAT